MTHDELRDHVHDSDCAVVLLPLIIKALRSVAKLHKRDDLFGEFCDECEKGRCGNAKSVAYPCATLQAIAKELE